jgi:2-haloacid dehalogenase
MMSERPTVVVFDVNETLSDMAPMGARFAEVGAPQDLAQLWFATLLRDGFALAAAGDNETFSALGEGVLRQLLRASLDEPDLDTAVAHVMGGFPALPLHPDVAPGIRELRAAGFRLVTLSNGSAQVAQNLLAAAGIRDEFEALLSAEDAGSWKPARSAYEYAARSCAVALSEMLLVAVHPWDINGAARAQMSTAWVNRRGVPYPDYFAEPTHTVVSLTELVTALTG